MRPTALLWASQRKEFPLARAIWVAFLVVMTAFFGFVAGFTVWTTWTNEGWLPQQIAGTLGMLPFAWFMVSFWGWFLNYPKIQGTGFWELVLHARPEDPDAAMSWKWGRQGLYAWLCLAVWLGVEALLIWIRER